MSLKTKLNCYTGWANYRLLEYETNLNNIITDILQGSNLKLLVTSMVGYTPKRLGSLDDLTQNQVITRVEWAVKELKSMNVIPGKSEVDGRLFAMRSSDQVFNLMWLLVSNDIHFLWERQEFLRLKDSSKLCEVPLKWVPDQIPTRSLKSNPTTQVDEDEAMLMGFGNTLAAQHSVEYEPIPDDFEKYSGQGICMNYKPMHKRHKKKSSPEKEILEILQGQFNCTEEGKALGIKSLRDMANSQAFCALINTFVPDTFSNEILLQDRWAFNLALKTFEKMTHLQTPVTAEDLSNYDSHCFAAYLCTFFMLMYKFKQCQAVVRRLGEVKMTIRRAELELGKKAPVDEYGMPVKNSADNSKSHWTHVLKSCQDELGSLAKLYDVTWCENWVKHVTEVQNQTRQIIRNKTKDRFDVIVVPQNMSVSDVVNSFNLNLSITKCNGFAQMFGKEMVAVDKKVVVRNTKTGEFLDDFSGSNKDDFSIRKLLGYNTGIMVEINPDKHPKYNIFVEVPSLSKMLRAGSEYLYMVFPGGMGLYENMLQKAVKSGEFEMVRKFVVFFNSTSYVNSRDPNTGNTPLHWACKFGYESMALFLLEHGAQCNAVNATQCTPFSYAMSSIHKNCAHLLIEWGCDTWYKDHTGKTAWDVVRNQGMKDMLFEWYEYLSDHVPRIVKGETETLFKVIENHVEGVAPFASIRSRAIQGSTLLHTACHFAHKPSVEMLLSEGVDVNVRDYKGATPLHRVKSADCMAILQDAGADVAVQDAEGNTPLHMLCFEGSENKDENERMIEVLVSKGSNILARNFKNLMPIHCAAMGGNIESVLSLLHQNEDEILESLMEEPQDGDPPSLIYLALNDSHLECAAQLLEIGIKFKEGEAKKLLHKYLTGTSRSDMLVDLISFLLDNGASVSDSFDGQEGLCALHLVSGNVLFTDLIELMVVTYEADVDIQDRNGSSPLFYACKNNNPFGASLLLEHGANIRLCNHHNLMAFDLIPDFDDWIDSGFFSPEMTARLKAYSLKQTKELISAISRKVKGDQSSNDKLRFSIMR